MTIKDTDKGYSKVIRAARDSKREQELTVGVHSDAGSHEGGMSILAIANIHEFGEGNAPARSFIRAWADETESENVQVVGRLLEKTVLGKDTVEGALRKASALFVASVQARITGGIAPANEPSTVARKGSSTPLIDKGQLLGSIRGKVNGSE